jgi:hypothetical protein
MVLQIRNHLVKDQASAPKTMNHQKFRLLPRIRIVRNEVINFLYVVLLVGNLSEKHFAVYFLQSAKLFVNIDILKENLKRVQLAKIDQSLLCLTQLLFGGSTTHFTSFEHF